MGTATDFPTAVQDLAGGELVGAKSGLEEGAAPFIRALRSSCNI